MAAHPLNQPLSWRGLNPIKSAHHPGRPAQLAASAFNQTASSPGYKAYYHAW